MCYHFNMLKTFKPNHPVRQFKSFKYATEGLIHAVLSEPNFRIQLVIVALSTYLGKRYEISRSEWSTLSICLGMLLIVELINTVIEEIMDQLIPGKDNGVKIIKDLSAAAVLITSLVALTNLVLIFGVNW